VTREERFEQLEKMAPETSTDTMTRDQEISMIVIRTMEALKRQEEERDRIRGQSNQMTKCLRAVMDQQGEFDGKDVTKYLKVYWREVKLHDLKEGIAISKFATLVELEIKGIVDKLIEGVTSWEEFSRRMKEEFLLQDGDRVTQAMFLDWVNDRNKGLEPQELLREFSKRFNQLSKSDGEAIKLQKSNYFLRSADSRLRDDLEYALDLLDPKRVGNVEWKSIEEAVLWVSQRRRQRELDEEAIAKAPVRSTSMGVAREKKEVKAKEVSKDGGVDELSRLMEGLKILTIKVDQLQGGANVMKGGTSKERSYNCIWCDSTNHARKDCVELTDALRRSVVKYVGEVGNKKLVFADTEELIPPNYNKGGMKVLLEKHLGKRGVDTSIAEFETNVYNLVGERQISIDQDEVQKKRLAEQVRRKSGWNDPVVITAITAEVGAAWEAKIEDKRKGDSIGEGQAKEKQPRVETERRQLRRKDVYFDTPASQEPSSSIDKDSQMDLDDGTARRSSEKSAKKGPGWLLSRDVEMELDPQEVAKKFWRQEVKGFTNEEFFGSLRKDVQDLILSKAKKKRFYKEGPHSLELQGVNNDNEGDNAGIYGLEMEEDKISDDEKIARVYDAVHDEEDEFQGADEAKESFWARSCSECEIQMEGLQHPVRALIDSGSEVNLVSKKVYEEGQWFIDRDIDWKVNSVNRTRNALWGACPDIKVKIGNVVEPINIFVHETLPYPVLLGQPFITKFRLESKVLNDGTHMAKVRNTDGTRIVQFPTVLPGNERNRKELRGPEKPGGRMGFM
jgi:hypothetical protein